MMTEQQHILLKIIEECAEVSHVASKCIQFGLYETKKDADQNNLERLCDELQDLQDTIKIAEQILNTGLPTSNNSLSRHKKQKKLNKYKELSRSLGQLQ